MLNYLRKITSNIYFNKSSDVQKLANLEKSILIYCELKLIITIKDLLLGMGKGVNSGSVME